MATVCSISAHLDFLSSPGFVSQVSSSLPDMLVESSHKNTISYFSSCFSEDTESLLISYNSACHEVRDFKGLMNRIEYQLIYLFSLFYHLHHYCLQLGQQILKWMVSVSLVVVLPW